MQATIPGKSLLLFSKMIQCLSRIGEDLFIEATEKKTRSAFFCFSLNKNFFEKYHVTDLDDDGAFRCKLTLKSCLAVFKSTSNVEKCEAAVRKSQDADAIIFDMHCKLGVKKTYKLDLEECEPLKAVYSKENCYNRMQIQAATLSMCLNNFPANLEEITLILGKEYVKVRSFIDTQKGHEKDKLKTELILNPNDFENYDFNSNSNDVELTFCLKEMKALLTFCEKNAQTVQFYMEEAGKPVLMSVGMPNTYDADFVIATLLGPGDNDQTSQSDHSQSKSTHSTTGNISTTSHVSRTTGASSSIDTASASMRGTSNSSPSNQYKRKADSSVGQLLSPPAKHPRYSSSLPNDEDQMDEEEDGPMILWTKDLPRDSQDSDD